MVVAGVSNGLPPCCSKLWWHCHWLKDCCRNNTRQLALYHLTTGITPGILTPYCKNNTRNQDFNHHTAGIITGHRHSTTNYRSNTREKAISHPNVNNHHHKTPDTRVYKTILQEWDQGPSPQTSYCRSNPRHWALYHIHFGTTGRTRVPTTLLAVITPGTRASITLLWADRHQALCHPTSITFHSFLTEGVTPGTRPSTNLLYKYCQAPGSTTLMQEWHQGPDPQPIYLLTDLSV